MGLDSIKRKTRTPRPELSVFDDELDVAFNPKEFAPDIPSHARAPVPSPSPSPASSVALPPEPLTEVRVSQVEAQTLPASAVKPVAISAPLASEESAKLRTNPGQTSDKVRAEPKTDLGQTSDKVRTLSPNAPVGSRVTSDKVRSQPRTDSRTDLGQTSDKVRTKGGFFELVGLQRQIVLFLHDQAKLARNRVTDPIAITVLAGSCGTTVLSAQKTIQRLEGKGLLRRVSFRNGRGGWTRYEVAQDVFQEILHLESQDKLRTNLGQTSDELRSQPRTERRTSASSSSSVLDLEILKTTTGAELPDKIAPLPDAWDQIDSTPLADLGFSRAHLIQLARDGKLSVEEVQDSIHFFAFDMKRNGKGKEIKGPPVSFFMGILRKGVPYAPPSNFESPEEAARRLYVESKRRLKERRESQEQEMKELEFSEWRNELTREAINAIVPEVSRSFPKLSESSLKAHFDEYVWPNHRAAVPGVIERERAEIAREMNQTLGEVTS